MRNIAPALRPFLIALLVFFIAATLIALAFVASRHFEAATVLKPAAVEQVTEATSTSSIPPYTEAVKAQLAAHPNFNALISYTDHGFEPANLTVAAGDTVRFTNNSNQALRVAEAGTQPMDQCREPGLDSCRELGRGEFFEYSFADAGTVTYTNANFPRTTGVVTVTNQ
jgi:plastocyanin